MTDARDRKALGILTLLMLALSLPFVRRAYFVDDFYFVTMAKGILEHPARPYDFVSDDAGLANVAWERGQAPRMVNPPLFHYFLAAVIKLWGDDVWKLRTASLVFPLIALYAAYFLGKRFVRDPLAAACLLAVTPAYWLTSYSLLIDSALAAFFLASLACFISGQEKKRMGLLIFSGVLMGMTLLTKYTGVLIFPVVLIWHVLNRERCSWVGTGVAIGISGALFLLWGIWGLLTYGQMHIIATFTRGFHPAAPLGLVCFSLLLAGGLLRWKLSGKLLPALLSWGCWIPCIAIGLWVFAANASLASWLETFYIDKVIAVASFLGGSTVFLFFAPYMLWKSNKRVTMVWGGGVFALFSVFISRYGGFDALQSATLAFFIGSSAAFLLFLGLGIAPEISRPRVFLLCWLGLGLLELVVVMPWTAARYLLIVLPPVCWLFQSFLESSGQRTLGKVAWGTTAILGAALAYVDFAQAGVIVTMADALRAGRSTFESLAPQTLRKPVAVHHWYNLADTFDGSQPYVAPLGWENSFPSQTFPAGSLLLRRIYRKSSWWTLTDTQRLQPIMMWEFDSSVPLRVMDVPASAGFYASCWGSLPYAITRHPLERFVLYIVK